MDLFISDPQLVFEPLEKRASATLEGDSSTWSRQILSELFREAPETSEYTPRVMLLKADEESGYAYGGIIITTQSDSALATEGDGQHRQIIIPVIVKQHVLQPLDLLMQGKKMLPLTGVRLREALFRPATFDMVTRDWGDSSVYNMFYPPGRTDNSFGSGTGVTTGNSVSVVQGPGMKYSSGMLEVEYPLLEAIGSTIGRGDLAKLSEEVQEPGIQACLHTNPAFLDRVLKLAEFEETALESAEPVMRTIENIHPPDVVQMGYSEGDGEYWVKHASRAYAFARPAENMDRRAFLKFAGEDMATRVDMKGTVTVAKPSQTVQPFDMDASQWAVVTEAGIYRVKSVDGRELTGWVLPSLIDFDGTRVPMAVFTNGSDAAVQDQIVGAHVASGTNLRSDKPAGTGVFYMTGPSGIEATVPATIIGREAGADGAEIYHITTLTDGDKSIKVVPGLRKMIADPGDGLTMLPGSVRFLHLEKENTVGLVESPGGVTKTAAAIFSPKTRVWSDGMRFGLEFENMPKVASLLPTNDMSRDEATFALCLVGTDIITAQHTLDKVAATRESTVLGGTCDVKLAADYVDAAFVQGVNATAAAHALRQDLLKEAAVLPESQTVDSVLSLRFINPENVRMYVGYLPYLEKALSMICELTLVSRLGMSEVPVYAAARAARALDDTIQGLKGLALRDVDEYAQA